MNLPIMKSESRDLMLMQNRWASILNPVIANPSAQSIILPDVSLKAGVNVINHLLQRKLVGWRIIRQRAASSIFDQQDDNPRPELTLILVSSAPVVCNIEVF